MSAAQARLRGLIQRAPRSADDLLQFFLEGLDWPLPPDFAWSDIQIDWDPQELHLDPTKVAKLKQISQLPPLTKNQEFGVFVLGFEGGQLPVGAIRRLVDRLVRNERGRKGKGTHPQFALNDLLFFCLTDGTQNVLHLVNFREIDGKRVLRTLSWSNDITDVRLDLMLKRSVPDLAWTTPIGPKIAVDPDALAGFGGYREPIKSAAALATRMADVARDVKAEVLALHEVETDAGPMRTLHEEIRTQLIADLTPERFADVYAQTMVYGLLTARIAHPEAFREGDAGALVEFENPLLNAIYTRFREDSEEEVDLDELGLADLSIQLGATDVEIVLAEFGAKNKREDPVVHFYEEFLAKYDPKARISAGAFYTPLPVVRYLVRAVDTVLKEVFGLPLGVADAGTWGTVCAHLGIDVPRGVNPKARFVAMLDPATGTGTFLVEWVRQAEQSFRAIHPRGDWPAHLRDVVFPGMHAFELTLAPYAIAHLRIALAAKAYGTETPPLAILLTDSLDYPTDQTAIAEFDDPVAEEGERAAHLKRDARFTVVIGNPPYEREKKAEADGGKRKGGVVRYGTDGVPPLLAPLTKAMTDAGKGRVAKGLHNIYVYFWRLATWRASERPAGPGIVAYITGASYLDGVGLGGLRSHMRQVFDDVKIVDLGGEGRGANKEENIFDILTPVAIAVGVRSAGTVGCVVNYTRVSGTRSEKLDWLDNHDLSTSAFEPVTGSGLDVFVPHADSDADRWPLSRIFPWSGRGIQLSRSWPVAETEDVVRQRWATLIDSPVVQRASLLKESRDSQIARNYPSFLHDGRLAPLAGKSGLAVDGVHRLGFRSFDEQWCIADRRAIDMPRPPLWRALGATQVFLTGLADEGGYTVGPVLVPQVWVPDLNAFNNRGGLAFPLFADGDGTQANIDMGLTTALEKRFRKSLRPEDIGSYVYALLGTGAWLRVVGVTKSIGPVGVPVTADHELFAETAAFGQTLLWIATRGQRGSAPAHPHERATVQEKIGPSLPKTFEYDEKSEILRVGNGRIAGVSPEVWEYEVSGLRVVPSWLSYRLAVRAGKKSSALDEIRPDRWRLTPDLVGLLHTLEGMAAMERPAEHLLRRILASPLLSADGDA